MSPEHHSHWTARLRSLFSSFPRKREPRVAPVALGPRLRGDDGSTAIALARNYALLIAAFLLLGSCDHMITQNKAKAYSQDAYLVQPADDVVPWQDKPHAPPPLNLALLQRGQERFRIYCTPCHSELGDGNGMIVHRGFPHPPSYHIDRLRQAPTQHFYDVITLGHGAMYSFAGRVAPADRWAIAAYIRALQLSQHVAAQDLSQAEQQALR